jgi:hypothetical protein
MSTDRGAAAPRGCARRTHAYAKEAKMADEEVVIEDIEHNMGDPAAADAGGPEDPEVEIIESDAPGAPGLLVQLCKVAEEHYGLHIGECDAPGAPAHYGPVHHVHAKGSFHYQHRAADISGIPKSMMRFGAWVEAKHRHRLKELIHNPGSSVKNGERVDPSFWGKKTWAAHQNHVHIAI